MGQQSVSDLEEVLTTLREEVDRAEELQAIDDPPEKPYSSKYKAREILKSVLDKVRTLDVISKQEITVHLLVELGSVDRKVEELVDSQKNLGEAVEAAKGREAEPEFVWAMLKALNQLGIVRSARGDLVGAKSHLYRSVGVYKTWKKNSLSMSFYGLRGLLKSPRQPEAENKRQLEVLNTHTYYYLAQVHEGCGQFDKSGRCCHITLSKQLSLNEYEPLEWASNAAALARHYTARGEFTRAKNHLAASWTMLEKRKGEDDEDESVAKCTAGIARALGAYALALLQRSEAHFDEELRTREAEAEAASAADAADEVIDEEEENSDFPSLDVPPELQDIPDRLATNFDEARDIFLMGQKYLRKARDDYFTLEHHCVDFTEICQELSSLHKHLVYFEDDSQRKFLIHKRRIGVLEEPLNALSESLYLLVCRQLMYELAETHVKMMDAKMQLLDGDLHDRPKAKKVNKQVRLSIRYFERYLETLFPGAGADAPEGEVAFPEDSVRPALVAYFHLARLWDRYVLPEGTKEKLECKTKSLHYFNQVVQYCDRHPRAGDVMLLELPLCREMIHLLKINIEGMKKELLEKGGDTT